MEILERAKVKDDNRTCGYSESLKEQKIRNQLDLHLDMIHPPDSSLQENDMYQQMASLEFKAIYTVLHEREKPIEERDV